MLIKEHKDPNGKTTIAICDKSLIGQIIKEGNLVLDLSSEFYNGHEIESREAGDLIRNADSINLVGKKSIKLGIDEELIDESDVKYVNEIPHAKVAIVHE